MQKSRRPSPLVLFLILLLAASLGGLGYFYYQASTLQNLSSAGASLKIVNWQGSQSGGTATFEVKVTNGNSFDVTVVQLAISVVDGSGTQVAGNTISPQVLIPAGSSVTTEIRVNFPDSAAGHSIQAIINTPYGHVNLGSG
jgi:hypothetical protein